MKDNMFHLIGFKLLLAMSVVRKLKFTIKASTFIS